MEENQNNHQEEKEQELVQPVQSESSEGLSEADRLLHETAPQEKVATMVDKVREELSKVLIGQHDMVDLLLAGLLTNGHVLLEGVPGIAKTLTAKLMSQSLSTGFNRIQFTPDMMPSDVIGTTVYNMKTSEFGFNKGPVFSNIILIDEVNRAPAKTQAALFEVMEERQVSVDGVTYPMEEPFMIVATQNPIEQEGTYRLPEAQLDRFLFRVKMNYPSLSEEEAILMRFKSDFHSNSLSRKVGKILSEEDIASCRSLVEAVFIKDELISYIARIVHDTRENGDLFMGASPRASLSILKSAKAMAAFDGRNFVSPDDIRKVAVPVLNHRVILSPEREMEGVRVEEVIEAIVKKIEVPR